MHRYVGWRCDSRCMRIGMAAAHSRGTQGACQPAGACCRCMEAPLPLLASQIRGTHSIEYYNLTIGAVDDLLRGRAGSRGRI